MLVIIERIVILFFLAITISNKIHNNVNFEVSTESLYG